MEKLEFHYELSDEAIKHKKEKVEQLKRNPHCIAFMKEQNVDETFLYNHSGKLEDYCAMLEKCVHCQGLDFCRQPMRGTRLMLVMDGFLKNELKPCSFLEQEQIRSKHIARYVEADIADNYFDVDLLKLDITKECKEYKIVYNKVIDKRSLNDRKGLYLWGKPGAGKTYLAAGITNYFAKENKNVAIVNVPKLIADLKRMFSDSMAMDRKLKQIQYVDVLVLDDIGGESVTPWSRDDILLPLLDARMEDKKLTFFTSNYAMGELKQRLSSTSNKMSEPVAAERLFERMRTLSDEIFVKGESRRK